MRLLAGQVHPPESVPRTTIEELKQQMGNSGLRVIDVLLQSQKPRCIGKTDLFLVAFCQIRQFQQKQKLLTLVCPWTVRREKQTLCRMFPEEAFPEYPGHLAQYKGRVHIDVPAQ